MKAKYLKKGDFFKFTKIQSKWNVVTSIAHFTLDAVNTKKGDVLLAYKLGRGIVGYQCISGEMDLVIPDHIRLALESASALNALDILMESRKLERIRLLEEINRVSNKLEIIENDLQELESQMLADIEERAKRSSIVLNDDSPDETQDFVKKYCPGLER